jgi:hypothetical protein
MGDDPIKVKWHCGAMDKLHGIRSQRELRELEECSLAKFNGTFSSQPLTAKEMSNNGDL